jgi:hypothetical protein
MQLGFVDASQGPFRVALGLMHRSKERRFSITSSASASKFGGGLYARCCCSAECCGGCTIERADVP